VKKYNLIATSTFGIESIVSQELNALGYNELKVEDGRVLFQGYENDIAKCNIWLRSADRVLINMGQFNASDFGRLFQLTNNIKWEDIIPVDGKIHITGKSIKSKLFSVPDCQSIVKKAIIDALQRKYKKNKFTERGPLFKIEVSILKDIVTLSLDTTGPGLHRRGYRTEGGEAPLRENLAAALVLLSRWDPKRPFADPLCGSGTIAIETALIGRNIAAGLNRKFVSEEWPFFPKEVWKTERENAKLKIRNVDLKIYASDIDSSLLQQAKNNAKRAGVADCIEFQNKPVEDFVSSEQYGCIICNPPYGERLGDIKKSEEIYKIMGNVFLKLDTWSYFIITSHTDFERYFGRKSTKNRKLYNGNIKCYLYQYYGPLPKKCFEKHEN
jgi:putative N6-adenine-specific DNA methylase